MGVLHDVCSRLAYHPPDWNVIRRKAHRLERASSAQIALFHVETCLEKIAGRYRMSLDGIRSGTHSGCYEFWYDNRRRLHADRLDEKQRIVYDLVIEAGSMPAAVDVLPESIAPENCHHRVHPLRELYGKDVASVAVVPANDFESMSHPTRFEQRGGILVPLYTDRTSFLAEAKQMIQR